MGDNFDTKNPDVFWDNILKMYVSDDEIVKPVKDGKIDEFSIEHDKTNPNLYDVTYYRVNPAKKAERRVCFSKQ